MIKNRNEARRDKNFILADKIREELKTKGIEIEDNGIRETDIDYRRQIDEEIQKLLLKYRPVVHTLKGTTEERIKQIMKTIQFNIY